MQTFNLEQVRDNAPFEVYFRHVGWVEGKLKHVSKPNEATTVVKIAFADTRVTDCMEFVLPDDRLRMKEE